MSLCKIIRKKCIIFPEFSMETERHPFIFSSPKAVSITPFYTNDSKSMNEDWALKSPTSIREIHTFMLGWCTNINIINALQKGISKGASEAMSWIRKQNSLIRSF